jgi:hypothetical protein
VHGRAEGTAAESQWAIDPAQQLMRQLMLRMVVSKSRPFSAMFFELFARAERAARGVTNGLRHPDRANTLTIIMSSPDSPRVERLVSVIVT